MTIPQPDTQPEFYSGVLTKRFIAWLVDTVVIIGICLCLLPFTFFSGLFFFPVLMVIVGFFYRFATLSNRSSTWGMRMTAIELRDQNDNRFDASTALLHTLGYTVSITMAPLQLISVLMMLISARGQGLTDMLLGTVALNNRRN